MQQNQPRRHYPDFTDAENEAILRQVHSLRHRFETASKGAGSNSAKRVLWQEIAENINLNSSCRRSFSQIKQRHRAMRFEYNKYRNYTGSSPFNTTLKWKPFMDVLAEISSNENVGDSNKGAVQKGSSSPSTNLLDSVTILSNIPNSEVFSNHQSPAPTSIHSFQSAQILSKETPVEEIIQVHSDRSTRFSSVETESKNGRKRRVDREEEEDLARKIQIKQLEILDKQYSNLLLEEQLLQARLMHFAKKNRLINEALLKGL